VADGLNDTVSASTLLVTVLSAVTELGGTFAAVVVFSVTSAFLAVRRRTRLLGYVVLTGAGLAVLVPLAKALVGRARPLVDSPVVATPGNASFPSGHAMVSLVTCGVLLFVALPAVHRGARAWLVAVAVLVVLAVGVTRLALGVHFVSDVLAGWALGVAWLSVTTLALRGWQHEEGRRSPDRADVLETGSLAESPGAGRPTVDPPGPGRVWRGLAAGAVVSFCALTAVGLLVTGPLADTALGRVDVEAVRVLQSNRTQTWTDVAEVVGLLSGTAMVIAVSLATAVLARAVLRSWRPVVFVVAAVIGEVALYLSVSSAVNRGRPPVADLTSGLPVGASWPSGHAAAATVVYGALAILVVTEARGRRRWLVVAVPVLIVPAVSLSRVYVAAHHPSDVVAGLLLGTAWLLVCAWSLRIGVGRGPGPPQRHTRPAAG